MSIKNFAIGPDTNPPITKPNVADAIATANAPSAPFASIIGPYAAEEPTPPISDIEPAHNPNNGFMLKNLEIATPHMFCITSITTETINIITIATPPCLIIFKLALKPIVEKNATMKNSLNVLSNLKENSPVCTPIRLIIAKIKPPITGAGMQYFLNTEIFLTKKSPNKNAMQNIKNIFINDLEQNKLSTAQNNEDIKTAKLKKVQFTLNKLGMTGEKGSSDIINICKYLIDKSLCMSDTSLIELSQVFNINSKSMEQRIRRAVAKGMSNIANLGIEDNLNEIYIMYSNSLFNFEEIKAEMDFIRGKSLYPGKVNIRKFIDGLIINTEY